MTRIVVVSNRKGGSAKSTTAVNLAAVGAAEGQRVLLADFDPQPSATRRLSGYDVDKELARTHTSAALFADEPKLLSQLAVPSSFGYDLVPSAKVLALAEDWLRKIDLREIYLRGLLQQDQELARYDLVIIDTPGDMGLITFNALMVATDVIIPAPPSTVVTDELPEMYSVCQRVSKNRVQTGGEALASVTVLLVRARGNARAAKEALEELNLGAQHGYFGLCSTVIPEAAVAESAAKMRIPVVVHKPKAPVSLSYVEAFRELLGKPRARASTKRKARSEVAA